MHSGSGYESVDTVLRRRGFEPNYGDPHSQLIIPHPQRKPAIVSDTLYELFGHKSFRQFIRKLIEAGHSLVPWEVLQRVAPGRAPAHAQFLADLRLAEITDTGVRLLLIVHNIGPTMEWYIAEMCRRELRGAAERSVHLKGFRDSDYDVLAWLAPTLVHIEAKAGTPEGIASRHLGRFLQRAYDLSPEMSILMVDTESEILEVIERLDTIAIAGMKRADPPENRLYPKTFEAVEGAKGIHFGYPLRPVYVTNTFGSMARQIRACLRACM